METENTRKTLRFEHDKRSLISRLNRIEGQINGVKGMIVEDRYCDDILIQLSAIDKAVKSIANLLLERHIKTCVKENLIKGNDKILDDIVELLKRFQ